MNFIALKMLTGDRAKYLGLVFAIAFCTFLLENQTSIFAGILSRTGNQILDVTDAEVWVMDPQTKYFEETKALKDRDVRRLNELGVHQYYIPQIMRLFFGTSGNSNTHPALEAYRRAFPEETAKAFELAERLERRVRG